MKEYVVLEPNESLSSAVKICYFFLFLIAAVSIFWPFLSNFGGAWEALSINQRLDVDGEKINWNSITFIIILCLFFVLLLIHLVRVYLSMELLEDPSKGLHRIFLMNLPDKHKKYEQAIRIILIGLISFKLISFFGYNKKDPINILFDKFYMYLIVLYVILLSWDIYIIYSHKKNNFTPPKTFWKMNLTGVFCFAILKFFLPDVSNRNGSLLPYMLFIFIIVAVTFSSLIDTLKDKDTRNEFLEFAADLFRNIKNPYYGKRYEVHGIELYTSKDNEFNFREKCSQEDCNFELISNEDEMLSLMPIDKD